MSLAADFAYQAVLDMGLGADDLRRLAYLIGLAADLAEEEEE
jgi:hypothetical protein